MPIDPADLSLPPTQPLDLTELNDWLVAQASASHGGGAVRERV